MPQDSGFTHNGQPIMVGKKPGRPNYSLVNKRQGWYPDTKKLEVAQQYAVLGNMNMVSEFTKVPVSTIRMWRREEWFKSILAQIQDENKDNTDAKFSRLLDKALDKIEDRLDNGDFIYNQKTGEMQRKPVTLADTVRATTAIIDKRNLLRGQATSISEKVAPEDQMKELAKKFEQFSKPQRVEATVVESVPQPEEKQDADEG